MDNMPHVVRAAVFMVWLGNLGYSVSPGTVADPGKVTPEDITGGDFDIYGGPAFDR